MRKAIHHIIIVIAVLLMALGSDNAAAIDLPVKTVHGEKYYYYTVGKGESIYGIAKHLGVSIDQIKAANPAAANGVKKGDILLFPYDGEEETSGNSEDLENLENPIIPTSPTPTTSPITPTLPITPTIAVMLPLGSELENPAKRNKLWLDFYKGMLIAADSLSHSGSMVNIVVRDTEGLSAAATATLAATDEAVATAAIIIAPDDDATIAALASGAAERGSYVLNLLSMRDSSYLSQPTMIQANIPQRAMYERAIDALLSRYAGYQPVFLRSTTGRNDKESFIAYAADRYAAKGIVPVTIDYGSSLLMADLETLPTDADQRYIFIPSAGSLQEFNKFAYVLKSYRDRLRAIAAEGDEYDIGTPHAQAEVFGYPDWTAFRGDALDTLHRLGATVYSRFFDDFSGYGARHIDDAFRHWYGAPYIESIPTYGLLGFDTAAYLIENIRANDGSFDPTFPRMYRGVQSTFELRHSGAGYVNNALFIITYLPGGHTSAIVQ